MHCRLAKQRFEVLVFAITFCVIGFSVSAQQSPTIIAQPDSQSALVTSNVTFSVTAVGHQPLDYQWRFNSSSISGATNPMLTLTFVQCPDSGSYSVAVSNKFGVVTSSNAVLTVMDDVPPVLICPSNITGGCVLDVPPPDFASLIFSDNSGSVMIGYFPDEVVTNGNAVTVMRTYFARDWCHNMTVCTQRFDVCDSSPVVMCPSDLALQFMVDVPPPDVNQVIATDDCGTPVKAFVNDFYTTNLSEIVVHRVYSAQDLCGKVAYCLQTIRVARFDPTVTPPSIKAQPVSQAASPGQSVTFSVEAEGDEPMSYQWRARDYFNNPLFPQDIPGATNATLTLTNLQMGNDGQYSVTITNAGGFVTSLEATLAINGPVSTPKIDLAFDRNEGLVFYARTTGTRPIFFKWSDSGVVFRTNSNSSGIDAFAPDLFFSCFPHSLAVVVSNLFGVVTNQRDIALICNPPVIDLRRGLPGISTDNSKAVSGPTLGTPCGILGASSKWFSLGAQVTGLAAISTEGTGLDTRLAVFTGPLSSPADLTLVICNDNISPSNLQSRVVFRIVAGQTYWLVVYSQQDLTRLKLTYGFEPEIGTFRFQTNGAFELASTIAPALPYVLQGSSNLQSWLTLFSTNFSTNGYLTFVDTNAARFSPRFYRIAHGP